MFPTWRFHLRSTDCHIASHTMATPVAEHGPQAAAIVGDYAALEPRISSAWLSTVRREYHWGRSSVVADTKADRRVSRKVAHASGQPPKRDGEVKVVLPKPGATTTTATVKRVAARTSHSVRRDTAGRLKGCNCSRSKCLKRYCECFVRMQHCGPKCKCDGCFNTESHEPERSAAIKKALERTRGFRIPAAIANREADAFAKSALVESGDVKSDECNMEPDDTVDHGHRKRKAAPSWSVEGSSFKAVLRVLGTARTRGSMETPDSLRLAGGCVCRRSKCIRGYCVCFLHHNKCGLHCKCVDCENRQDATADALQLATAMGQQTAPPS